MVFYKSPHLQDFNADLPVYTEFPGASPTFFLFWLASRRGATQPDFVNTLSTNQPPTKRQQQI